MREAGLALGVAAATLLPLSAFDIGPLRILETGSLDLRFRVRGTVRPGNEVAVVLVDDRSLAAFGRWPLNRHLYAKAVRTVRQAGAKEVVFDLLFAESEQDLPQDVCARARRRGAAFGRTGPGASYGAE